MIKKKVLVHGSLKSLQDFFSSPFNAEFMPMAIVTDDFAGLSRALNSQKGGLRAEIFDTENLPRFALRLIDGILLTDASNVYYDMKRFTKMGIEPRKIILWNNLGVIESFDDTDNGVPVTFMEGLQFHIRNDDDKKFLNQMRYWFQCQRQFYAVSPKDYPQYVAQEYQKRMGKPLDWDNLQTYAEKMQWIKLCDSTPIKTRLADKFLVRQWVTEKIGAEYVIPLYGVWNNFDEIDFDTLPNQFILKCNHGCGMNIICRDKNTFDFENAREKLTAWLKIDYGTLSFEPHYSKIPRKIIAEQFMTDGKNFDLIDYKFICFNSKPYYCQYLTNRSEHLTLDYFDMDWNHLEFERLDHPRNTIIKKFQKPKSFEKMKKLASELCKDFVHVRVDFYEIDGKIYFGEMTFTPAAGCIKWNSEGTDEYFGSLMTLPNEPYKFWEE